MNTLYNLQQAVQQLPAADLAKFCAWFAEFDGQNSNERRPGDLQYGTPDSPVKEPQVHFDTTSVPKTTMTYRIALHQSEEGYSVSAPELPGCWSQGATEEEAIENIRCAIREYLEVAIEDLMGEGFRIIEVAV